VAQPRIPLGELARFFLKLWLAAPSVGLRTPSPLSTFGLTFGPSGLRCNPKTNSMGSVSNQNCCKVFRFKEKVEKHWWFNRDWVLRLRQQRCRRVKKGIDKGTVQPLMGVFHDTIRSVTCHMGSHSVTRYPTQVNTPRLNPSARFTYTPEGWKAELT